MKTKGLTLIETIVGIALVSALVVVFGVSLLAAVYAQRIKLRNMAAALADQELTGLRVYDTSSLPNQTNGPLADVLFYQGAFAAAADGSAPSQPNALAVDGSSDTGITALMPLPKNAYSDFTMTASMAAGAGAPGTWRVGLLFRARDLRNYYAVYLTSSSLVLMKNVNDVPTTLYSDARSISTGSWQELSVTATGSSISVDLNGTPVTTQNDSSFSVGKNALVAWNGAPAEFDDVSIGGETWDFDAVAAGEMHDDWLRFGLGDLPNGTSTLTVSAPYADTSFRTYTVNVSWLDRSGTTRTLSRSMQKRN